MGSLVRHLAWRCLRGGGIGRNIASAAATKPTSSSQGGGGVGNGATSGMVYGGPKAHDAEMKHVTGRRVTVRELPMFGKKKGDATKRLAVLTAYDYPSAVAADTAGADVLLVGDSLGMVVHGLDTTVRHILPFTHTFVIVIVIVMIMVVMMMTIITEEEEYTRTRAHARVCAQCRCGDNGK